VGEKPGPPPGGEFLVVNSTLVILLLERWLTPSCPILYFVIEYKLAIEHSWTVGRRRKETAFSNRGCLLMEANDNTKACRHRLSSYVAVCATAAISLSGGGGEEGDVWVFE
jgi:hypothetical protein